MANGFSIERKKSKMADKKESKKKRSKVEED